MVKDNRCRHNATIETTEDAFETPIKDLSGVGIEITNYCKQELIPTEIWRTVRLDNQVHDLTDSQFIDMYIGRQKLNAINKCEKSCHHEKDPRLQRKRKSENVQIFLSEIVSPH